MDLDPVMQAIFDAALARREPPAVQATRNADIRQFATFIRPHRFRFSYLEQEALMRQGQNPEHANFFAQAIAALLCFHYPIGFLNEGFMEDSAVIDSLLAIVFNVREAERDGSAVHYIQTLIVEAVLVPGTTVPAAVIALCAAQTSQTHSAIQTFVRDALAAERCCFAGLFDETADEETSHQSEVEGPVAEALAEMSVYPLALTRELLRFFEAHVKLFSLVPLPQLLSLLKCA